MKKTIDSQHNPIFSIIVAVFNGQETLQQCIDSVINQSYHHKELIIIDGGSKDGTLEIINENHDRISFCISEPDNGIYDAWNKGLQHATGSWVAFLGSDDVYLPGALQAYADYLIEKKNLQLDYVSSLVNLVREEKLIRTIGKPWSWNSFSHYMNVAHVGSLHNKALFEKYGVFNTDYKICADYELLLRPRSSLKAGFLKFPTVNMSIGGASDSALALKESAMAKVKSGGRNVFVCHLEYKWALFKLYLRKLFWY